MKRVFSLLTALLICFGVSACNSKKENREPEEEKIVEYKYISGKRDKVGSSETYVYTFQIDVTNNTDEEVYILPRELHVRTWRDWILTDNSVGIDSRYESTEFKVYLDQTILLEVSISYALQPGAKQSIYIVTENVSAELGSIIHGGVKYTKRVLKHFKLSVGSESTKDIASVDAYTLLSR